MRPPGTAHLLYRPLESHAALQWTCVVGGTGVALICLMVQPSEGWSGILTAALFGITLALGGAVFLAIQAAASARWWLPLRSVPILLARTLPAPVVALVCCLVFGLQALYPWARPEVMEASHLLQEKAAWLNAPLFLARALVVLVLWFSLIGAIRQRLAAFSHDPSIANGQRLGRTAVSFLIVYAITNSVAAWDWGMSLEPEWFSTMYSVYVFAGTFLGGIAAVALLSVLLDRAGLLTARLQPNVLHDLGKLLFAFSTFWAYIWFCQYLLIWYGNLPEETGHYAARLSGGWSALFFLNLILNWVAPFVILLSAGAKCHAPTLSQVAAVVLAGRWLDTYLLVAPVAGPASGSPLAALSASIAVLGGMGLMWRHGISKAAADATSGIRAISD